MEQTQAEQRKYRREYYSAWRSKNKDADNRIKLRYWARKVLSMTPDEIAKLLDSDRKD